MYSLVVYKLHLCSALLCTSIIFSYLCSHSRCHLFPKKEKQFKPVSCMASITGLLRILNMLRTENMDNVSQ